MSHPPHNRRRFALAVPAAAVAVLLMLTACSSGSADGSTEATSAPAQDQRAAGRPDGMPGGGGVSGTIAAISGAVLQIQDTDSQTAVAYTADTVITQTVSATLDQVAVGSCILAVAPGSTDDATAIPTSTVSITQALDGACSRGFGGGQMPTGMPEGMPTDMPTDLPVGMPTDMPTGGAGAAGTFGEFTSGLVTAVAGTTITVQVTGQDDATSRETVEVDADTAFMTSVTTDAAAIAVGLCAAAQGESDDSGQMTATALTLSVAGDDGCAQGVGFGGGMSRGSAGNQATDG